MPRHAYGACHNEDCPACETEAERRAEDRRGGYSDRELDFMADAAAADMVWGRGL